MDRITAGTWRMSWSCMTTHHYFSSIPQNFIWLELLQRYRQSCWNLFDQVVNFCGGNVGIHEFYLSKSDAIKIISMSAKK
jgi:hypothetical protein